MTNVLLLLLLLVDCVYTYMKCGEEENTKKKYYSHIHNLLKYTYNFSLLS